MDLSKQQIRPCGSRQQTERNQGNAKVQSVTSQKIPPFDGRVFQTLGSLFMYYSARSE